MSLINNSPSLISDYSYDSLTHHDIVVGVSAMKGERQAGSVSLCTVIMLSVYSPHLLNVTACLLLSGGPNCLPATARGPNCMLLSGP